MTTPSVLYIASASVTDPLIVSQVIRYLQRMRNSLAPCHLITFERDDSIDFPRISEELLAEGIHWYPVEAWSRLRSVGFWLDRRRALACARRIVNHEGIDVVHCRSFLAGTLGRKLKSDHVRFLYDMRGLWSLEKRDKGTIRNSPMFKVAYGLEQRLFRDADHIVSLTHQGKRYLRRSGVSVPIDVIPTCVDLQRFRPQPAASNSVSPAGLSLNVVSAGTLGAGYLASEMCRFAALLKANWPVFSLRVLTASDRDHVLESASNAGLPQSCLRVSRVAPEAVPEELAAADVGLCFVKPTEAKVASCPTKLGEYLASGIPVVATDGVGDVTQILEQHRVGVIVRHDDESSWPDAIQRLELLLQDSQLASRCRSTAESLFGLDEGAANYLAIYERLVGRSAATRREAA
jgi:glycosyltransferase involved in cell wall biosynthesis